MAAGFSAMTGFLIKFKSNRFSSIVFNPYTRIKWFLLPTRSLWIIRLSSRTISFTLLHCFKFEQFKFEFKPFIWPYLANRIISFQLIPFAYWTLVSNTLLIIVLYNQNSNTFWPVLNSNSIRTSFRYNLSCSAPFQIILFANEFLCPIQSFKQQVCCFSYTFEHYSHIISNISLYHKLVHLS